MKFLVLSVALLFLTGAQGRHFWQSDEPKPENSEKTILKILQNAIAIVTDVVKNLEYSEIAKEYKLKEKIQAAKDSTLEIESVIEDYLDEVWKKGDEVLHKDFPVFRTQVLPILEDFDDKIEEQLENIVKQVVPVGTELFHRVRNHVTSFLKNLESLAEKGRDKLREEVDMLRVKLQPHVEDVRAEYEKYRKEVAEGLDDRAKQWKEQVEKQVSEIRENSKPYIENMKKYGATHAEEIRQKLEKLLKEFYASKEQSQ